MAGSKICSCRTQTSTWRTVCSSANLESVVNRLSYPAIGASRSDCHRFHHPRATSSPRFFAFCSWLPSSAGRNRDFHLAHRALHSQKQSIVGHPRIIDASSSTIRVPTRPQNWMVCQSRPLRASREASIDERRQPGVHRCRSEQLLQTPVGTDPPPDRPRSSSITCTSLFQPSRRARSTKLPVGVAHWSCSRPGRPSTAVHRRWRSEQDDQS